MVAKLIVWDTDRERATARMLRALGEYEVGGLTTLIPFHSALLATEQWARGETCRDLTEDPEWLASTAPAEVELAAGDEKGELTERDYKVEVDGRLFGVKVIGEAFGAVGGGNGAGAKRPPKRERAAGRRRRLLRRRAGRAAPGLDLQAAGRQRETRLPRAI